MPILNFNRLKSIIFTKKTMSKDEFIEAGKFFKQMINSGLIVESVTLPDDNFGIHQIKDHSDFDLGFAKILNRKKKIIDEKFTEYEFEQVTLEIRIIQLCMDIESMKYRLIHFLKSSNLRYSKEIEKNKHIELDELSLGNIVDRINYRLFPISNLTGKELDEQMNKRKKIDEFFMIDLRNHIIHRDFEKHNGKIVYGNPVKIIDKEEIKKLRRKFVGLSMVLEYFGEKLKDNTKF